MTREELLGRRWGAVLPPPPAPVEDVVARLTAVQAQDANMGVLAIGLRAGAAADAVQAALDEGRLVRTHVLRPTWHIVHAADLRWMMHLTKPRIETGTGTGYRQTGLTPEVRAHARGLIEAALQDGPLSRDEIMDRLQAAGVTTEGLRSTFYMFDAELHLVACNGPRRGKTQTYDLVDRRIPAAAPVPHEEAVANLTLRYLRGHGPATEKDLSWWSGLGLTDVRKGLAANSPQLAQADYEGSVLWYDPEGPVASVEGYRWLPAYDEALVAFADRSAVLDVPHVDAVLTKNGIFNPIIVKDGRIVGTWKRTLTKTPQVEALWFGKTPLGGEESRQDWQDYLTKFVN